VLFAEGEQTARIIRQIVPFKENKNNRERMYVELLFFGCFVFG